MPSPKNTTVVNGSANLTASPTVDAVVKVYDTSTIAVLEDLEAVRTRPGMYIGSTGTKGLHHLVYEIVDNSVDEALAGHCNTILVELLADGSASVTDNGRGIPTDIHPKTGKSGVETVMTVLHAGGKFGGGGYKVSGGLHGVGASAVNFLSEYTEVTVWRDQKEHFLRFDRGIAHQPLSHKPGDERRGTRVKFKPDPQIFTTDTNFDYATLSGRLRELAYLNAGVRIEFVDRRPGQERTEVYFYEGGIKEYVSYMTREKEPLHPDIIYVQGEKEGVQVEVAFQWCSDAYNDNILGFANNIRTIDGGTHLEGLRTVLTRTMNLTARKLKKIKEGDANLAGENIREGLTAVISVKVPNPEFEGQTKTKLGNPEVRGIVDSFMGEVLNEYLEFHPAVASAIIDKAIQAFNAAEAARRARELVRRKSALESSTLPGKLADCSSRDPRESEIFIVEGDSAGGCFSGDTKVALADGRHLSFLELIAEQAIGKEHFGYTIRSDGTIAVERLINVRRTKTDVPVIRITLDNGEQITCTPDHLFMLRDGSYKPAISLTGDDSLMPLYRKFSSATEKGITINGYEMVWSPRSDCWLFTHLIADWYNRWHGVYGVQDGEHCHHIDFNKLNNNPTNLQRLSPEAHLELHRCHISLTLHRPDVIAKCRQLRQDPKFRLKMSQRMQEPQTREILSSQAKAQWNDPEYKDFMVKRWQEFYLSNPSYQCSSKEQLVLASREFWSKEEHRRAQAIRLTTYFAEHPEAREHLSQVAQEQWSRPELVSWRKQQTRKHWTPEFREKRKQALHLTYYRKTLQALKQIEVTYGWLNLPAYDDFRLQTKDKSLLRFDTFCGRYFQGNESLAKTAITNFNHRVQSIEILSEVMDVYDLEVPRTHNFALASGVFVHNSAKQGRDRHFQAILPLRGKVLNIEKAEDSKIYKNNEIQALITGLGLGIKGEDFKIEGLRYHKIILLADADVDGAHIRTLLLTFFYRYQRELVDQGFIYIGCPPLYKVERGKNATYCYGDREKEAVIASFPANANYTIQRFKGLGEMMPQQLWDTTMNPATRKLKQITIEDAAEADRIFTILMGDRVAPRREFIETYGSKLTLQDLDI